MKASARSSRTRRMKCACASCTCTVDMNRAVRRNNLVYCSETCARRTCTPEVCRCEHDHCTSD